MSTLTYMGTISEVIMVKTNSSKNSNHVRILLYSYNKKASRMRYNYRIKTSNNTLGNK